MRSLSTVFALGLFVASCSPSAGGPIEPAPAEPAEEDAEAPPPAVAEDAGEASALDASSEASADSGFDAGPPPLWKPDPAPAFTTTGTFADASCTFAVGWLRTNSGPVAPTYGVVVHKRDTTPGSCNEPKGWLGGTGGSYVMPNAMIARHPTEKRIVTGAVSKGSPSGSSKVRTSITQIDWTSGRTLRQAFMSTKDATPVADPPSTYLDGLTVTATQMVFEGFGWFTGSTGTGSHFTATYVDFLGASEQPGVGADTAVRFTP